MIFLFVIILILIIIIFIVEYANMCHNRYIGGSKKKKKQKRKKKKKQKRKKKKSASAATISPISASDTPASTSTEELNKTAIEIKDKLDELKGLYNNLVSKSKLHIDNLNPLKSLVISNGYTLEKLINGDLLDLDSVQDITILNSINRNLDSIKSKIVPIDKNIIKYQTNKGGVLFLIKGGNIINSEANAIILNASNDIIDLSDQKNKDRMQTLNKKNEQIVISNTFPPLDKYKYIIHLYYNDKLFDHLYDDSHAMKIALDADFNKVTDMSVVTVKKLKEISSGLDWEQKDINSIAIVFDFPKEPMIWQQNLIDIFKSKYMVNGKTVYFYVNDNYDLFFNNVRKYIDLLTINFNEAKKQKIQNMINYFLDPSNSFLKSSSNPFLENPLKPFLREPLNTIKTISDDFINNIKARIPNIINEYLDLIYNITNANDFIDFIIYAYYLIATKNQIEENWGLFSKYFIEGSDGVNITYRHDGKDYLLSKNVITAIKNICFLTKEKNFVDQFIEYNYATKKEEDIVVGINSLKMADLEKPNNNSYKIKYLGKNIYIPESECNNIVIYGEKLAYMQKLNPTALITCEYGESLSTFSYVIPVRFSGKIRTFRTNVFDNEFGAIMENNAKQEKARLEKAEQEEARKTAEEITKLDTEKAEQEEAKRKWREERAEQEAKRKEREGQAALLVTPSPGVTINPQTSEDVTTEEARRRRIEEETARQGRIEAKRKEREGQAALLVTPSPGATINPQVKLKAEDAVKVTAIIQNLPNILNDYEGAKSASKDSSTPEKEIYMNAIIEYIKSESTKISNIKSLVENKKIISSYTKLLENLNNTTSKKKTLDKQVYDQLAKFNKFLTRANYGIDIDLTKYKI